MTHARQRGSILVLALLVSAAASVAGMYMVLTSDLRVRANRYLARSADAARVAVAGLQLARDRLGGDAGWAGGTVADPDLGSQSITVSIEPIGTLRRHATAIGVVGDATQQVFADLRAVAHPVLDYNIFSRSTVTFDNATAGGFVRANGNVTVVGDLDFSGTVETLTSAYVSPAVPAEQVVRVAAILGPPPVSLSAYSSLSTVLMGVPWAWWEDAYLLEDIAFRPDENPYGNENVAGAYIFDANGRDVVIRDVYIEGTLTILDAPNVLIEGGFHQERADTSLATLLVQGNLEIRLENGLDEHATFIDYNGDGDFLDAFTPFVEGIVYVTGTARGAYGGIVRGALVAGRVIVAGSPRFLDESSFKVQPVIEFTRSGAWDLVAGSIGSDM